MSALRKNAARLVWLVPFTALAFAACEHNATAIGSLATIEVTRNPETLVIGTSAQFTAIGRDANGTPIGINPTWSVAASGGTVGATGVFTAGTAPGTFANTVTATVGSISGSATVIVLAGPPASIVLTPTPVSLATGGTQQFAAVVSDAAGNVLTDLPNWSVAAGGGAIGSAGLFTAGNTAGTFTNTVVASIGGISAFGTVTVNTGPLASITVTPNPVVLNIGDTQQYTAVGRDANGNIVPAPTFTPAWLVVASGGGIDAATGLFTAGTVAGTFANTIRACSTAACGTGAIRGFATVTVNAGALATITVTPNPISVGTLANQQFAAVGRDANGNIIGILPTWSVDPGDAGGAILNPSGVYTAPGAAGFDTVRATVGSISGPARVNVTTSTALISISVTPNPANVVVNGSVQMTATGFDANDVVVPTPGLTWSVVPPGGGFISPTGLFTAGTVVGLFTNSIKATSGSVSGLASANVTAAPNPGPSLGAAETHGLLAGSTFTCVNLGTINADASLWPGTANSGFPPCVITGQENLGTPAAEIAQGDLTEAYLALAAMPCGTTITADLGGTTLAPGVYCSGSSVGVTGTVTLDGNGDSNALFVIRAPSTLTTAGNVALQNGAQAKNVYWWVGSSATIGVSSQWQGNIIAFTSITLNDNATLTGRALARNGAVTLGTSNTITLP